MLKRNKRLKKPIVNEVIESQLSINQKMHIQLLEQEIQQAIIELNALPRAIVSGFLVHFMTNTLLSIIFPEWDRWVSNLFIKQHLLSDEMDATILTMASDHLKAKNVIEQFSQGLISRETLLNNMEMLCQQIKQSTLLKKLNIDFNRSTRFMYECMLNKAHFSDQDLAGYYKLISDKHKVTQSLAVEDILSIANKKHSFSLILNALFHQLIMRNFFDPLFNTLIPYPVLGAKPQLLGVEQKNNLTELRATFYIENLQQQKKALNNQLHYHHLIIRLLVASLFITFLLFGIGQGQLSIFLMGLINTAFSGVVDQAQRYYARYTRLNQEEEKYQIIKELFTLLAYHVERNMTENNGKTWYTVNFKYLTKINEEKPPIKAPHLISILVKIFREHHIKTIHDKKNQLIIDGQFIFSKKKFKHIEEQLANYLNYFLNRREAIKKIKKIFLLMRPFGIENVSFLNESLQACPGININFSLSGIEHIEKIQEIVFTLTGKSITIFNCYNYIQTGEFTCDGAIAKEDFSLALKKIASWREQSKNITIQSKHEMGRENILIKSIGQRELKNDHVIVINSEQQKKIKPSEQSLTKIVWKSGTFFADRRNNNVYPLHGRQFPIGRDFITARLNSKTKINQESVDKILQVMEQGKVSKRNEQGIHFLKKAGYFAKVYAVNRGTISETKGVCTRVEISEDGNHRLWVMTDVYKK